MTVVIVESPAKAKTINKYLGKDFKVLASFGHIRDLPSKDGSVRPDDGFAMEWELTPNASKSLSEIKKAVKTDDTVILATDPDREGEAISWHITEILSDANLLKGKKIQRVVFHEVTKNAIKEAFNHPRDVDQDLVDAYLARRALDYLVGFNLSPVLWRKLPGSKSAGRVQSVALRLICERESEIEAFNPQEYWSVKALLQSPKGDTFEARLVELKGEKLDKFTLGNQGSADAAVKAVKASDLYISNIEHKQAKRNPYAPFRTSTLQQEASRKLGFGATRTMRCAQGLYEGVDIGGETVGLITYMRTDGTTLSGDAIGNIRDLIVKQFGKNYLPNSPRVYTSKQKNAQEAHEAIRPTDVTRTPDSVARYLDDDALRLYTLIWQRTVACQMESAVLDQVVVDIDDRQKQAALRANGSVIKFDGFLKVYEEDRDDAPHDGDDENENRRLPALNTNDNLKTNDVIPAQHFTQPPPRYSEASLVKKLEELGIGRPSTYASIIQVLQARKYVTLEAKRFIPVDRGRIVTAFLANFFPKYVQYDFTANLESMLDDIADKRIGWKDVLKDFWKNFKSNIDGTKELRITDVLNAIDADLGAHFFPPQDDGSDPRVCPVCKEGRLNIKLGKFGAFIGCSKYPDCKFTKPLEVADSSDEDQQTAGSVEFPKALGAHPDSNLPITIRLGPYGPYVQLGEATGDKKKDKAEIKRSSIPKTYNLADIDLKKALEFLTLPREVGLHPESKEMITAGIGRFGPYLKIGVHYKSIPKDDDVTSIGLNRAVDIIGDLQELAEKKKRGRWGKKPAKTEEAAPKTKEKKTPAKKTTKKAAKKPAK